MEIQNIINFNLKLESKVINISLRIVFLTMFHASCPWYYYNGIYHTIRLTVLMHRKVAETYISTH